MIPLRDNLGRRGWCPVTWSLIALAVVPYAWLRWLHYGGDAGTVNLVEGQLGLCPGAVLDTWRHLEETDLLTLWTRGLTPFLTYLFLHAGPVHLLANMLCLLVLGSRLERDSSWQRFLLFYLACGVLAGIAQCLWASHAGAVVLGSSGAVAGVIGAYLFHAFRARILLLLAPLPLFVDVPVWVLAVAWALLQLPPVQEFLKMGAGQPLDAVAHLVCLLAGLLLWRLLRRKNLRRSRP